MRILMATLSILFAASIVTVSLINPEEVTIRLWPDSPEYSYPATPVSWVIFFSAFAGFVFTGIIAVLEGSKTRLSNARLRGQVRRLQQELDSMRKSSLDLPSASAAAPPPATTDADEGSEAS